MEELQDRRHESGRAARMEWVAALLVGLLPWCGGCSPDVGRELPPGAGAGVRAKGSDEQAKTKQGKPVDEGNMKRRVKGGA